MIDTQVSPPSLLELPSEILVSIFALLDLPSLSEVSRCSKALYGTVYGPDQDLWRDIHRRMYDEPRLACAFPKPRTDYDWRRSVIERHVVFRAFEKWHELESRLETDSESGDDDDTDAPFYDELILHRLGWNAKVMVGALGFGRAKLNIFPQHMYIKLAAVITPWTSLVVRVCLGLYFDLPARGSPSLNEELLDRAMTCGFVYYVLLLQLPLRPLRDWSDCDIANPAAPLFHLMTLCVDSRIQFPPTSIPFNYDWTAPLSERVQWYSIYRATADLTRHEWVSQHPAKPIQDRGTGVLNLHPPQELPAEQAWDWAGVNGLWECVSHPGYGRRTGEREYGFLSEYRYKFPTRFQLTAVSTRAEVDSAYFSLVSNTTGDLWDKFPELNVSAALPPLFFYGQTTMTAGSSPTGPSFVYGVVHLSSDEPPDVVWVFATTSISGQRLDLMMRGVQIGGCGSLSGVAGTWGPRAWGPEDMLQSRWERDAHRTVFDEGRLPQTVHCPPDDYFRALGNARCWRVADLPNDAEPVDHDPFFHHYRMFPNLNPSDSNDDDDSCPSDDTTTTEEREMEELWRELTMPRLPSCCS